MASPARPSKSGGGKRKAPASEPGTSRSKRGAAGAAAVRINLSAEERDDDETMDGGAAAEMLASRQFWEGWHTDLLIAWIRDWKQPVPRARSRENLIDRLVLERATLRPPREDVAITELQAAWRRVNGKSLDDPAPGRHVIEFDEEEKNEAGASSSSGGGRRPPLTPAADENAALRKLVADLQATVAVFAQPARTSAELSVEPATGSGTPSPPVLCLICASAAPPEVRQGDAFNCRTCAMRGDLTMDHVTQVFLLQAKGRAPPAAAAGAVFPLGQSDATSMRPPAIGRDRVYAEMMSHPASPTYTDALERPGTVSLAAMAFDRLRSSYNVAAYKIRSPALIRLVQSGKLLDLGYALPEDLVPNRNAATGEGPTVQLGEFTIRQRGAGEGATPIRNVNDIFRAFVATIVPALVGHPEALAEWCSLLLSVSEVERTSGWDAAFTLLTRQLNAAIPQGRSLAAVDQALLVDVVLAAKAGQRPQPNNRPQAVASSGTSAAASSGCRNWNNGKACRDAPCGYKHICIGCGSTAHRQADCNRGSGSAAAARPRTGAGKPPPRGSGSSVNTAADQPPPAATGASSQA